MENARCANYIQNMRAMLINILLKRNSPKNISNPSKQSLKGIFVFKYSETYLNIKRITKQFTTKEKLTVDPNLEVDKAL